MKQAVRKWLNKHVDMLDETPREAKGSTRGCDLWARKHARLVHDHAYLQGNYNGLDPLKAYNKARWELWQGLADEEKKEWNRKGETARALVTKDLSKVEPPLHTAAYVSLDIAEAYVMTASRAAPSARCFATSLMHGRRRFTSRRAQW